MDTLNKKNIAENNTGTETVSVFGLPVMNKDYNSTVTYFFSVPLQFPSKIVATPNVDHIVKISRNKSAFDLYSKADYFTADGWPVALTMRLVSGNKAERIAGSDLFVTMLSKAVKEKRKSLIIGGEPEKYNYILEKLYSKLDASENDILLFTPPMGFSENHILMDELSDKAKKYQPDYIFVCLGFPKQEKIALLLKEKISCRLIFCVGASLDFFTGMSKRAPKIIRKIYCEWLWRLLSNPKRFWKRYLVDDTYFALLLIKQLRKKRNLKYTT